MKQIEIFKTNITQPLAAATIIQYLLQHFDHYTINFDLEDCDNILRVETLHQPINPTQIELLVTGRGYVCCHLAG